jgi:predicted glutamine amidotransferase
MINIEGIKHIEREYGLENLFNYLEKQLGGHGNGICYIYNDGSYYIEKGVDLTNHDIAEGVMSRMKHLKWIIYHTRLASVGNINNRNCHPFECNGNVLAMNGTERKYTVVNKHLTDTENILLSSDDIMADTRKYNSVFLGYKNGRVFANKNFGSLKYIPCKNGGKIFASSFPLEYYKRDTVYEAPQIFVEGERMKPLETAKQHYKRYNVYGICIDDYYGRGLI